MAHEIKNMAYWKAKNGVITPSKLPRINHQSEGNTDTPDGKSGSSPLQADYDLSKATVSNNKKVKSNINTTKQSSKDLLSAYKAQDKMVDRVANKAKGQSANPRKTAIDYLVKKGALSETYK